MNPTSMDLLAGETRRSRARQTGTVVVLVDARCSPDFNEDEGGRWITFCDTHHTFCQHETRALATSFLPVPGEWCEVCADNLEYTSAVRRLAATS